MVVLVIGSGPSGLHFALTALSKGQKVVLLDVGHVGAAPPQPDRSFVELKKDHPDAAAYFLGDSYSGAQIPPPRYTKARTYYQLPPSKDYVFARPKQFSLKEDGLNPMMSFAAGGLAECWTAGVYTFNDSELAEYPFGHEALAPHYAEVAKRIGVGGEADDLAEFMPVHEYLNTPIALDPGSALLLKSYQEKRAKLRKYNGIYLGRSRQAALSSKLGERDACSQCGRCLWGCPNGALYTPFASLRECLAHPNFTYLPGCYASHFTLSGNGMLDQLIAYPADGGPQETHSAEAYVLACGTLGSSAIFLRTLYHATGEIVRLSGLMDNRQVLAPFYNLGMLGRGYEPSSYQYHQLATGLCMENPAHYVHGQITMFSTGTAHPVIQQLPLGLGLATKIFSTLRSGLGVLNLNFHDTRRPGNYITLDKDQNDVTGFPQVRLRYRPRPGEKAGIRAALSRIRSFFWGLGAPLVPGMTQVRPMGASVHYAGTLPMTNQPTPLTVSADGRSHDFSNLYVADGASFPFLPAKNLTFTLMANASRIAEKMF